MISDLNRLENETLPTYFRHRRFQSLVRQLNFYNFRKINKERNLWVYKHPLFHRDRPEDLGMLRRRTCPGVDGRKSRPDLEFTSLELDFLSPVQIDSDGCESNPVSIKKRKKNQKIERSISDSSMDEFEQEFSAPIVDSSASAFMSSHATSFTSSRVSPDIKKQRLNETQTILSTSTPFFARPMTQLISPSPTRKEKVSALEQSHLVSKVAQKLEEHIKRASSKTAGKSGGIVTPPYDAKDTMKYHALTYDDEFEIYDTERRCVVERRDGYGKLISKPNDFLLQLNRISNDAIDEGKMQLQNAKHTDVPLADSTPPVDDSFVISQVTSKVCENGIRMNKIEDAEITAAVAEFCMTTNPNDPNLSEKVIQLMSIHRNLTEEFCTYQVALNPNHLLPETDQHAQLVKQIFLGDCVSIIRGFKTWLLNKLTEIMTLSKSNCWNEADCISECYQTWFSGVSFGV